MGRPHFHRSNFKLIISIGPELNLEQNRKRYKYFRLPDMHAPPLTQEGLANLA